MSRPKMLGRIGWRGQCSCCKGPKAPKAIRAEEKRAWRAEALARIVTSPFARLDGGRYAQRSIEALGDPDLIPVYISDGAHLEWDGPDSMPASEAMELLLAKGRLIDRERA